NDHYTMQVLLPSWYYGNLGLIGVRRVERARHCRFPHLERAVRRLGARPLLMIHGGAGTYIKPEEGRARLEEVRGPEEVWLVEGAKHNQALQAAAGEYERRVREFFDTHLAPAGVGSQEPVRSPRSEVEGPVSTNGKARPKDLPSPLTPGS